MKQMADREKVIKGLEICKERNYCCPECPYYDRDAEMGCHSNELMADALSMLKEQEAVEPRVSSVEQRCGNCNKVIEMDGWQFCPWCGKRIDWKGWWEKNDTRK